MRLDSHDINLRHGRTQQRRFMFPTEKKGRNSRATMNQLRTIERYYAKAIGEEAAKQKVKEYFTNPDFTVEKASREIYRLQRARGAGRMTAPKDWEFESERTAE